MQAGGEGAASRRVTRGQGEAVREGRHRASGRVWTPLCPGLLLPCRSCLGSCHSSWTVRFSRAGLFSGHATHGSLKHSKCSRAVPLGGRRAGTPPALSPVGRVDPCHSLTCQGHQSEAPSTVPGTESCVEQLLSHEDEEIRGRTKPERSLAGGVGPREGQGEDWSSQTPQPRS